MKDNLTILFSAIFALIYRILVEIGVLDIDSFTFIIFIPIIIGFLPFLLQRKMNPLKVIVYPILSVLLFLLIAFFMRLEDLGCFVILLPPYILLSIVVSLIIYYLKKDFGKDKIKVHILPLLILPVLSGFFEKQIQEKESIYKISNKVMINESNVTVWNNLLNVPNLTNYIDKSIYNYLGFPNPIKSKYSNVSNVRIGYFSNDMQLNEKVVKSDYLKEISFAINLDKSNFDSSQTLKHAMKSKNIIFNSITYKLDKHQKNVVKLELECQYKISSNIPLYGEFWSKRIINDFEIKLLNALKRKIENTSAKRQ